ncbi:MAG: rod shape-determining protein MreC [Candidatus Staskawiczbacteria bacterium]|nr:rod shape-determining protein MreC [Candidatus Staskawiczbacteria bacterium]
MKSARNFSINKKSNNWLKILIGAVVLLFLIFILNIFVLPVRNFFYAVSSPIQKTFWTAGESSSLFFSSLLNANSLSKDNEKLKQENQKLLSQVAFLHSIEQGNQAQSDLSLSCQNSGFKFVMAGIIGLDDQDILSINKGSAAGISEGMPVINQQNVLFGKVFKVYKNFSKIMLISNKNSVVNVKIQQADATKTEIDGVVKGSGGLNAYLDLIPISSDINPEDILVTSSIEKSFPKDLLVGKIVQKQKNDQKPFQQAQINLFFNVKSVDNLFVITNYKKAN